MSYYETNQYVIPKKFKLLTCQRADCMYNEKPLCSLSHVELDDKGMCIFYSKAPRYDDVYFEGLRQLGEL